MKLPTILVLAIAVAARNRGGSAGHGTVTASSPIFGVR